MEIKKQIDMNVQEIYKAVPAAFWEGDLVLSRVEAIRGETSNRFSLSFSHNESIVNIHFWLRQYSRLYCERRKNIFRLESCLCHNSLVLFVCQEKLEDHCKLRD